MRDSVLGRARYTYSHARTAPPTTPRKMRQGSEPWSALNAHTPPMMPPPRHNRITVRPVTSTTWATDLYPGVETFNSARPSPAGKTRTVAIEPGGSLATVRSEEHTSELQSQSNLVCRLLLEKKKNHNRVDTRT